MSAICVTYFAAFVLVCLYCLNCTKFGQLVLMKILKIDSNRCQILRLKCRPTKFDFCWGSAQDPIGRAYSVPQMVERWLAAPFPRTPSPLSALRVSIFCPSGLDPQ